MKTLIQWSRSKPLGYEEYGSGSLPLHLKRSDPTGLGVQPSDQPGYVHHLMVQGTVFTADHYCVRDRKDGGVDVVYWNDSFSEGERFGAVRTFHPLSPDSDYGGAYNTKQSIDTIRHWAEDGARKLLIGMGFRGSRIGRWLDFPKPQESQTFHGLLVSNSLQQDHVFRVRSENRSWREWTDGVPVRLVKNGRLVDQKTTGRFRKPKGTQTLIAKSSTTTDNTIHAASNELEIDRDTAGASTVAESIAAVSDELSHLFTSITDVPDETTWPNGLYEWQIDATTAGSDVTFGCLTLGGSAGHFARVNSGATAHVGSTWTQTQGAFSGTGLHTASRTLTPPTGSASDRFEMLLAAASAAMHGNQMLTLELNEADDFVRGPWADLAAFTTAPGPRTKDVPRGYKTQQNHSIANGLRLFIPLLGHSGIRPGDLLHDASHTSAHPEVGASAAGHNWINTPLGPALQLGGGANNHLEIAGRDSLTGFTRGFTLLCWMARVGVHPGSIDGTLMHQNHATASHTWGMEIKDGDFFLEMHAHVGGSTQTITDDNEIPLGAGESFVFMGKFNPSFATNNAYLFIDGEEVQVATWATGNVTASPDELIALGGHGGVADRRVPGDFLCFALWDRALSHGEIAMISSDPMLLLRETSIPQMLSVSTPVSSDVLVRLDVVGGPSKDAVTRYDAKGPVSSDVLVRFDAVLAVLQDVLARYDLTTGVEKDVVVRLDVIGTALKDALLRLDLTTSVEATAALLFDLVLGISKDVPVLYDVLEAALQDVLVRLDVKGPVSSDVPVRFDTTQAVSQDVAVLFDAVTAVLKDVLTRFDVTVAVQKDVPVLYDVKGPVLKDAVVRLDTTTAVEKTAAVLLDLVTGVEKDVPVLLDVLGGPSKDSVIRLDVKGPVTADAVLLLDTLLAVQQDRLLRLDTATPVSKDVLVLTDLLQRAEKDVPVRFDLKGPVSKDAGLLYDLAEVVLRDVLARYDVTSPVSKDALVRFDATVRVTKDGGVRLDVVLPVLTDTLVKYDLIAGVEVDRQVLYDAATAVQQDVSVLLDVLLGVTKDVSVRLDLQGIPFKDALVRFDVKVDQLIALQELRFDVVLGVESDGTIRFDTDGGSPRAFRFRARVTTLQLRSRDSTLRFRAYPTGLDFPGS